MKLTVVADIHANLPALEAVLNHARKRGAAQTILNLGDSIGYGAFPEAVVKWVKGEQVISLLGDYDKKVISKKHRQQGWESVSNPDKRAMFTWTYHSLSKSSRRFLKSLPRQRTLTLNGVSILMSHGSPASPKEYLSTETSDKRLSELAAIAATEFILCGHSHQAFLREINGVTFLNPGSVGRPDDGDPTASYAILKIENQQVSAEFFRVRYNIEIASEAIRQAGLPEIFAQIIQKGLNYDAAATQMAKDLGWQSEEFQSTP